MREQNPLGKNEAGFFVSKIRRAFVALKALQPAIPVVVISVSAILFTTQAYAQPPRWQVIIAEAASEGYQGMYAVACVMRNRGGDVDGFSGAQRKDLVLFCNRQGGNIVSQARSIEKMVFEKNGADVTKGATLFENIKKYGFPKTWDRTKVVETVTIMNHVFFKEKRGKSWQKNK